MSDARRQVLVLVMLGLAAGWVPPATADSVLGTKHDLTPVGPGPIRAVSETEICAFCHTPHQAIANVTPLWSHTLSTATYVPYSSSTTRALIGQPTGSSKLCLSCHDGTVALGMIAHRPGGVDMLGGITTLPPGPSNLGTDLSDDHPVSFTYDNGLANADGQLKDPAGLNGRVHLDHDGQMQCTACHDPHDDQYGKFLVMDNTASVLCLACHIPRYWTDSIHRNSTARWNDSGANPWPHTNQKTVADNACENCHTPHNAGTKPRLLTYAGEEIMCYVCHNGNVAAKNVEREFTKLSVHPVEATAGVHDPMEDLLNPPRHVECVDCHNPHASRDAAATAPDASGALAGVKGVSASAAPVDPLTREYELCFRCHGDSANRGAAHVARQFPETNTRLEFATSSASYHPVEAPGKNADMKSLLAPWTASSVMYCTDCHNSDEGPGAGGTGPSGPHGSAYAPILERQLETTDFQPESSSAYALCYKCHQEQSILADESFSLHKEHVQDQMTACTTCHDPHGVPGQLHLINFNTTYVQPSSGGQLEYISSGPLQGACYLQCHGHDHNPSTYAPLGSATPLRLRTLLRNRRH